MSLKRSGKDLVNEYLIPSDAVQNGDSDKNESAGRYVLITRTVDEKSCNPLKIWHDIGEPAHLNKEQTELIKSGAFPAVATTEIDISNSKELSFDIQINENGVVYFELRPVKETPDRGYDYNRVMQFD